MSTAVNAAPAPTRGGSSGAPEEDRASHEPTVGELIKDFTTQASALIKDEMRLAQLELTDKGKEVGVGAGLLGGAGALALYGLGFLLTAIMFALGLILPLWASALIVAGVLFLVALVLGLVGRSRTKKAAPPVPTEAIAGLKTDATTVKEHLRR